MTNETEMPEYFIASKKRKVFAWFLDLIIVGSVLALLHAFLKDTGVGFWASAATVLAVEVYLIRTFGGVGYYILSIVPVVPEGGLRRVLAVDPVIKQNENWFTLIIAFLMINSGLKGCVRWTQGMPVFPMFGVEFGRTEGICFSIAAGLTSIILGVGLYKLRKWAFWLAIFSGLLMAMGAYMSMDQWPPYVEQAVMARRQLQGIPVRPGEVETARQFLQTYTMAFALTGPFILLFNFRRFVR
ncbi:MAG: hypothetical protein Q8Q08_01130 [Candidatus Omnitrophota bacterium]|nr:hypothetical protein [Candidatus Omnitrophota bacterium]MDZ4241277.1 hypothetical protein [Candidatus Omnitrophota bacterium]